MSKIFGWFCVFAAMLLASANYADAGRRWPTLAVTMTNDADANQIQVYDAEHGILLQTLSTRGKGGVGGNAGGVKQYNGELVAVVNYGSNNVALFRRVGNGFRFDRTVTTTSAPVSVDFGNNHMYVAGSTTVDSFALRRDEVESLDGTAWLALATGGAPPNGSTAQVGVVNDRRLLVTLKADPDPGTVDVIRLHDGAIAGVDATAISAPNGSLTPFGFSVYPDGTALITLAHSNQNGVFRDGAFTAVVGAAGQMAPCWTARAGKYVFTANAASRTISRLIGTGNNLFVDAAIAAAIPTGGPGDIDASKGVLGVIDHAAGQSHLTLFTYNAFGELTPKGAAITLGVRNANGIAIMVSDSDQN